MKVIVTASQVIEIEVPEDIDPEDVSDFVIEEIRDVYLGEWDFQGWRELKPEAIAR